MCSWVCIPKGGCLPWVWILAVPLPADNELHLCYCRLCSLQPVQDGGTAMGTRPCPSCCSPAAPRLQGSPGLPQTHHGTAAEWFSTALYSPVQENCWGKTKSLKLGLARCPPVFLLGFAQKLPEYWISCWITLEYFKTSITIAQAELNDFSIIFVIKKTQNPTQTCFLWNVLHMKSKLGFFPGTEWPLSTTAEAFLCLNYRDTLRSGKPLWGTLRQPWDQFVLLIVIGLLTQRSVLATSRTAALVLIVVVYSTNYILLWAY